MKLNFKLLIALCALCAALCSCSKLSSEAKKIIGAYYNPELSLNEPVMDLRSDGTCLVRAIRPGVLTYSVKGHWNVVNDSLVMYLDPNTLECDGDRHLVGKIPSKYARKIVERSDFNLQLEQDGVTYLFQRHKH